MDVPKQSNVLHAEMTTSETRKQTAPLSDSVSEQSTWSALVGKTHTKQF